MSKEVEVSLGNSRTIFKRSSIDGLDATSCWQSINDFIEKNPKLTKASNSSFIYFLESSEDILKQSTPSCLVGTEVIGFCDSELLGDFDLESMDLSVSTVSSYEYTTELDMKDIFFAEKAIREAGSYLPMWRVRFSGASAQLIHLEFWKS